MKKTSLRKLGRPMLNGLAQLAAVLLVMALPVLTVVSCSDYNLFLAMRGLSAHAGSVSSIGHVTAVPPQEGSLVDYLYVTSIGEKPSYDEYASADASWNDEQMLDDLIYVLDITDPDSPTVAGSVAAPPGGSWENSWYRHMLPWYEYLIVGGDHVTIYDMSTPASPAFVSSYQLVGSVRDLELTQMGHLAILNQGSYEVRFVDLSVVSSPTDVGVLFTPLLRDAWGRMSINGQWLAVGREDGITFFDISDEETPDTTPVGTYSTSSSVVDVMLLSPSRIAAAVSPGTLIILDVTDIADPVKLSEIGPFTVFSDYRIDYNRGDRLWVGDPYHLWQIDISDYAAPTIDYAFAMPPPVVWEMSFLNHGLAHGEYMYVPAGDHGLMRFGHVY